ncbi:NMRAL1, partial [Symbiodinium sp. CCMP2456]
YDLTEYVGRARADDVSEEMILEGGYVYRVVPVSFGLAQEVSPRKAVVAVHSVQTIETQKVTLDWSDTAAAVFEGARRKGKKRQFPNLANGVSAFVLQEEAGLSLVAENSSDQLAAMQVDGNDCIGCVSSRESFDAVVALPPKSRQVVLGIAFARGAIRVGTAVGAQGLPGEAANFALAG